MKKGSGISFHRFPHRNPQMLENGFKQLEGRSGTQIDTVIYAACTLRIPVLLFDQGKLAIDYMNMQYHQYLTFQNIYRRQPNHRENHQ